MTSNSARRTALGHPVLVDACNCSEVCEERAANLRGQGYQWNRRYIDNEDIFKVAGYLLTNSSTGVPNARESA